MIPLDGCRSVSFFSIMPLILISRECDDVAQLSSKIGGSGPELTVVSSAGKEKVFLAVVFLGLPSSPGSPLYLEQVYVNVESMHIRFPEQPTVKQSLTSASILRCRHIHFVVIVNRDARSTSSRTG